MHCVSLETTILTRRGWLAHDRVKTGDETIGYNPATRRSEWTPIIKVDHSDDVPVWRIGHAGWHANVTPNHRWFSDTEHTVVDGHTSCPECGWVPRGVKMPQRGVQVHRKKIHGLDGGLDRTEYREEFIRTGDMGSHHRLRLAAPADTDGIPSLSVNGVAIIAWLQGTGISARFSASRRFAPSVDTCPAMDGSLIVGRYPSPRTVSPFIGQGSTTSAEMKPIRF